MDFGVPFSRGSVFLDALEQKVDPYRCFVSTSRIDTLIGRLNHFEHQKLIREQDAHDLDATGEDGRMKPELTKEQILNQMTQLRSEYEMVRRKTKELGNRTTRLYMAIEDLNRMRGGS